MRNCTYFFRKQLGADFLYPSDAPDLSKYRLVDMFTSCTEEGVKNQILKSFTSQTSPLCVVITTIAFGMGIDCPDIRQEGHDGKQSEAYNKSRHHIDQAMADYASNTTICRREVLFKDFDNYVTPSFTSKCVCCDVCTKLCSCNNCKGHVM